MGNEQFYSLTDLVNSLSFAERGKLKRFCDNVERFADIWSARQDLDTALKACQLLVDQYVPMKSGLEHQQSEDQAVVGGALFCRAIIFYARATETSSKRRRYAGIVDRLSDTSKNTPKEVMKVRNDAIAHFGKHDDWADVQAVLHVRCDLFGLVGPHKSTNYRGDLSVALLDLIQEATSVCEERTTERRSELEQSLARGDGPENLKQRLGQFTFNPEVFFGSAHQAEFFRHEVRTSPDEYSTSHVMRASYLREPRGAQEEN